MRPSPHASPPTPPEDEFRYGWRYVQRTTPDGQVEIDQVPLTLEDVLHPQEDDHIVNKNIHARQCRYLAEVFETLPLGPPIALVTEDQGVEWGVEGMRHHSPDVAVFVGLHTHPGPEFAMLELARSGGRPVVVIEVVSPHTRSNDAVTKVDHYHRAGVPLYILVDQKKDDGPRTLVGLRWAPARFEEFGPDERGWLWVEPLGLYLAIRDNRVVCLDREGREVGDYARISRELEEADRRIHEQDQAIEEAIQDRDNERLAREEAQRQAQQAAEARDEAKRLARAADEAREKAERKAREEADARAKAEHRARDERAQATRDTREAVLELGEARFGPPDEAARAAVEGLTDLDALRSLRQRIRQVASWGDLLAPG